MTPVTSKNSADRARRIRIGAQTRCATALALTVALTSACTREGARSPNRARPVDEARAVNLIATTLTSAGERPRPGRSVRLASGRALGVDVTVEGHRYGISYLTASDLADLSPRDDLPPHMPDGDLPIAQGSGPDRDVVVLVLFADDYLHDDLAGDRHERTAIAAERRIQRDVRDFLTQARARKLP